jgi:hypothetical protein
VDSTEEQPTNKVKIPANPATISVARRQLMSVNVRQLCGAVRTKIVICAAVGVIIALGLAQAGPQVGVGTRANAGWCAPAHTVCPPFRTSPRVVIFAAPTSFYPFSCGYVSAPIAASTSFSNVSPVFDDGQTGIYRVPAPVMTSSPVVVPPGAAFGWRR